MHVLKQVGFDGGRLRIFDSAAAVLVFDMRQHRGAIQDIAFDAAGERLYTAGEAPPCGVDNDAVALQLTHPILQVGKRR
jgi:hypothetical protein